MNTVVMREEVRMPIHLLHGRVAVRSISGRGERQCRI